MKEYSKKSEYGNQLIQFEKELNMMGDRIEHIRDTLTDLKADVLVDPIFDQSDIDEVDAILDAMNSQTALDFEAMVSGF